MMPDIDILTSEKNAIDLLDKASKESSIYIATDWHMVDRAHDGSRAIVVRSDYHRIIKTIQCHLKENDVLIYLGDLVGPVPDKFDYVHDIVSKLHCKKIMICGNNDHINASSAPYKYLEAGFDAFVYALKWKDILFTHCPINNSCVYNIHGHLHTGEPYSNDSCYWKMYGVTPTNHINAYNRFGKPIALPSLIAKGRNFDPNWKNAIITQTPNARTTDLIRITKNAYERIENEMINAG